jgi:hypothetical protein
MKNSLIVNFFVIILVLLTACTDSSDSSKNNKVPDNTINEPDEPSKEPVETVKPNTSYTASSFTFIVGYAKSISPKEIEDSVDAYFISPDLPGGLSLNTETGEISGTATKESAPKDYTVSASNKNVTIEIDIQISVWRTKLLGVDGESTIARGVANDKFGNIYVTGYSTGALNGQTLTGSKDLLLVKYNIVGERQWTRLLGVAGQRTTAYAVTTDDTGNIFITGTTYGDLNGQTHSLKSDAADKEKGDIFVIKYNANGEKEWTRLMGTTGTQSDAMGVANDCSGDVYVTGYTHKASDGSTFDGQTATGSIDLLLMKYNTNGLKQWTRLMGVKNKMTQAQDIATDCSGNIYITGYTNGNLDGETLTGMRDFFVVKYDSSGDVQWTRLMGEVSSFTNAFGVAADSMGNVYVAGNTPGNLGGQTKTGLSDLYVVKYNSSGDIKWTKLMGQTDAYAETSGIAIDSSNNVYVTGSIDKALDGQEFAGKEDLFAVKYNSEGIKQWTRLMGVANSETKGWGISAENDNVYIVGTTQGNLDGLTHSSGTETSDLFLLMYPQE